MDSDETIQQRRLRLSRTPRACEACKIRKIRCDRSFPCSNCRSSGITCKSVRGTPASDSTPISMPVTELQKELSHLRDRVIRLEQHVRGEPGDAKGKDSPQRTSSPCPSLLYEGGSSFNSQFLEASQTVRDIYNSTTANYSSDVEASLKGLSNVLQLDNIVSSQDDCQFSPVNSVRPFPKMDKIPSSLAIAICRQAKTRHPVFLSSYLINDVSFLEDLCRKVYFPLKPASLGDLTTMHGLLASLLREHVAFQDPLPAEFDLKKYLHQCDVNFNLGIETFDLLAKPSFENIFALALGVMKAQGLSKPALCCSLLSSAISHCRTLGYCKETTYAKLSNIDSQRIRRVFWTLYVFDRNVSLLQGRPSYLQDCEIDAMRPEPSTNSAIRPWDESFIMAIQLANIQGKIYTNCYSRQDPILSYSEKSDCIQGLREELEAWYLELKQIDCCEVNSPEVFQLSRISWDITYYSILTLLLRPLPGPRSGREISQECVQAARSSLQSHIQCFAAYPTQESLELTEANYADWVLHLTSFTPFVALFLHVVSENAVEDLKLLTDVVKTLQIIKNTSKGSYRLYRICAAMGQVAQAVGDSGLREMECHDQESMFSLIDKYGHFGSGDNGGEPDGAGDGEFLQDAGELAGILGDWFNGESPWSIVHDSN